jgi:hypothetical protein
MSCFSISNILIIITIHVFHNHYYDDVAQVKCSLSRSDDDSNRFLISWWFILHTNHTHPLNWATGHQWHYFGKVAGSIGTTVPRGCSTARNQLQLSLASSSRPHCHPLYNSNTVRCDQLPAWIVSWLHGWNDLSFQLNVGHAFNMTWGTYNGTVLNRHRRNHYSPKPYKTPSGLYLSINTWSFLWNHHITKSNQTTTYSSQVTGYHPTSTSLSRAKHLTRT